jgi:Fe-S cluster biosynthesis and repair protein YggX
MPRSDRRSYIPSGLAERIDRVRGDESFEHWVRHQLESSVLQQERELGLVSTEQRDQIERQGSQLEQTRDRADEGAD